MYLPRAEHADKTMELSSEKAKVDKKNVSSNEQHKPRPVFKIGDQVRMTDGKAVGSIDRLEKGKAVVNYGMFTTNVSVDQLELVNRQKK